jgi:phage tail sheath protein FI
MPQQLTYPGVYVAEAPSGVHPIVGVATSITAFLGRTEWGRTDEAVMCTSWADFTSQFGGLWSQSRLGFAVRSFFLNGGKQALICRVYSPPAGGDGIARIGLGNGDQQLALMASSPGAWGDGLRVAVDHKGIDANATPELFNLSITAGARAERLVGVSLYQDSTRNLADVLTRQSVLLRWDTAVKGMLAPPPAGTARVSPADGADAASQADAAVKTAAGGANDALKAKAAADKALADAQGKAAKAADGQKATAKALTDAQNAQPPDQAAIDKAKADDTAAQKAVTDANAALQTAQKNAGDAADALDAAQKASTKAAADAAAAAGSLGGDDGGAITPDALQTQAEPLLLKADLFNILCIPPFAADGADVAPTVFDWGAALCEKRRAILLVDPPSAWTTVQAAVDGFRDPVDELGGRSSYAAAYFPRVRQPNPLRDDALEEFVPCGVVAGVMARTDAERGVWKAPAGLAADLRGVPDLSVNLTDDENGELNPLGVNCLRSMPAAGRVVWGARTLKGADSLASEWKYVPVRRTALFIEESLYRGTRWAVFEPNDEPLWGQLRLNVGSFMHQLFRQGAFQGRSPKDAYFVKCDAATTTQADRDLGVVNLLVGFAPLKPAEFVVIRLQQLAGQIET